MARLFNYFFCQLLHVQQGYCLGPGGREGPSSNSQVAGAAGGPIAVQVVLTGTPAGGVTAFIQLKTAVPLGDPLPALYASKQLLANQPYVSGNKRLHHFNVLYIFQFEMAVSPGDPLPALYASK